MINFKQRELSQQLFEQLHARFPEIDLVSITESYENPDDTWVNMVMPEDEERELALRDLAGELSTDLLLNYGYSITISAEPRRALAAA